MNPHRKETHYAHYLEEKIYADPGWFDTGIWVEVGGIALIVLTIEIATGVAANVGFRLVDENDKPLFPYRTSTNNRRVAHFSAQLFTFSGEVFYPTTFHMVVNCKHAKLQIYPDGGSSNGMKTGRVTINGTTSISAGINDVAWSHKPISTISVLPLVPNYQGGANTIFTYSKSRMPRAPDDDKPPVIRKDKINPASSSGVPPQ